MNAICMAKRQMTEEQKTAFKSALKNIGTARSDAEFTMLNLESSGFSEYDLAPLADAIGCLTEWYDRTCRNYITKEAR